jgi:hypothetical protein
MAGIINLNKGLDFLKIPGPEIRGEIFPTFKTGSLPLETFGLGGHDGNHLAMKIFFKLANPAFHNPGLIDFFSG